LVAGVHNVTEPRDQPGFVTFATLSVHNVPNQVARGGFVTLSTPRLRRHRTASFVAAVFQ
jgi:hypothetical protein